jgi:hypothetical protein
LARFDAYNVPNFQPNIPLKTMADGVIMVIRDLSQIFSLNHIPIQLWQSPVVKIIYTFMNSKEGNIKATDIDMIKNNRLYVVQYYVPSTKYQNYLPTLQR